MSTTTTISPNMNLSIPTVGVDPGPDWATQLNNSLTIIDAHNHASGSGVQINPSGLNINSLFPINNNSMTGVLSLGLTNQTSGSIITPSSYPATLLTISGNLFYNDAFGNQIAITAAGAVAGSTGTITGLPSGTAGAAYQSTSGTFQFQQATNTAANIDGGTLIIRYPGSYPTPSGNAILLEAPTSLSSQYSLTLPALPGSGTQAMTLNTSGNMGTITYDAIGQSMTSVGANAIIASSTRATGDTVGIGGVAYAGSSGTYSTTSASLGAVISQSVTITTSGRPVKITLEADGAGNYSYIGIQASTEGGSITNGNIQIDVNGFGNYIAGFEIATLSNIPNATGISAVLVPPSAISFTHIVGAGTYTYTLAAAVPNNNILLVNYCRLVAYEL